MHLTSFEAHGSSALSTFHKIFGKQKPFLLLWYAIKIKCSLWHGPTQGQNNVLK